MKWRISTGFHQTAIRRSTMGIVYMPAEPILISMLTKNTSAAPIAKYLVLMVDWSKYCSGMRQAQENAMAAVTINADLLA